MKQYKGMKQYECLHCKQKLSISWEEADGCFSAIPTEFLWATDVEVYRYPVQCNVFATERNAEGKAYFPEHTLIDIKK